MPQPVIQLEEGAMREALRLASGSEYALSLLRDVRAGATLAIRKSDGTTVLIESLARAMLYLHEEFSWPLPARGNDTVH